MFPTGYPSKIKFQILSESKLKKISVCKIQNKEIYDINSKLPKSEGVLDLRLGLSTQKGICSTCNENIMRCNGHFGYIDLVLPVFHCGFIKNIVKILQKICKSCGKLKCGCLKSKVVKKGAKIYCDDVIMTPVDVLNIFKIIPEECYSELGLKESPENLILSKIVVPPASIRPTVSMEEQFSTNEDDLTVKLAEILHTNEVLKKSIEKGNPMNVIMDDWDFLQNQVNFYINSDGSIRGLIQRLKGKHGRFRGNLSGKRVDFTGRTVISPDPNLSIEEVGIPLEMAKKLTIPEKISEFNKEKMIELIKKGPNSHPGANFLETTDSDGEKIRKHLLVNKNQIINELKIGDIVERHLQNGDIVLFNRQPSLHRVSIMAHKVRVHPHKTLRLNESVCTPYNADFDGDEMNIHVPQTISSSIEARMLMSIKENLTTPRNGEMLIAPTQDFITFLYLLSSKDFFVDRECFGMIAAVIELKNKIKPAIRKPIELFSGKQIFESIIDCEYINLEGKNRNYSGPHNFLSSVTQKYSEFYNLCSNDGYVVIRNGKFLYGRLDKSNIGSGNKQYNILYRVLKHSKSLCIEIINKISRLSSRMMGEIGFSIGIDDVWIDAKIKKDIVNSGYQKCRLEIENYKRGLLERHPGCTDEESLENILSSILSQIREDCGSLCVKNLKNSNSALIMHECGSKGSKINISQMAACVGQQIISGKRIPNGFLTRTLPHFDHKSVSPHSKGFVENSFFSGLTPTEFFFHAVSGREGLVDTAVKTAETGYMQRRLMKALEDVNVCYDYTVRNLNKEIIQFIFGDDGIDPTISENGVINFYRIFLESKNQLLEHVYAEKNSFILSDFMQKDINNFLSINTHEILKNFRKNTTFLQIIENIKKNADKNFDEYFNKINNLDLFKNDNKNQLRMIIYEIYISKVLGTLVNIFIEPGTAVGAIAGQSIGEPGTQMTLKTFHFAGVASMNITLGVPRIKEIINATKKIQTPIINAQIFNQSDDKMNNLEIARKIKQKVQKTILSDILVYFKEIFRNDGIFLEIGIKSENLNEVVDNLCIKNKIPRQFVSFIISENYKNSMSDIDNTKNKDNIENINNIGNKNDLNNTNNIETTNNIHRILIKIGRYEKKENNENLYFILQNLKNKLKNTIVMGIEHANKIVINNYIENKYSLLIEGSGLLEIFSKEGINYKETVSNDILDIYDVLGIEAARKSIINEILYTMGKHGISLDLRHIMLLADTMTYKGKVLGITRFGIKHMKNSTLMLASFEQTADHIFDAAISGKIDNINGVSENIIVGSKVPIGSGSVELLFNPEYF